MGLKELVKKYALEDLDMDYVGIASVDRFTGAPEGHRPEDILPGAAAVIVMAIKLPQGAVQAVFRSYEEDHRFLQCIYGTHGYALTPNYHLVFASYRMSRFLEKRGFITTPLPSGPGAGGAPFSHRHAAVAAGLGEFGWSGLFMTPDAARGCVSLASLPRRNWSLIPFITDQKSVTARPVEYVSKCVLLMP